MIEPSVIRELVSLLSVMPSSAGEDRVSTEAAVLERYAWDALGRHRAFAGVEQLQSKPGVVVTPVSTQEVSAVLALASRHGVPVVPYGGGTGVMGGILSIQEGILLNLQKMDSIISINTEDETVVVQPGVLLESLNDALKPHGLMVGHDPWSQPIATVGGAVSTNGVGYLAAKYGPMGEQVLGLEVVLADGSIIRTRRVPKRAGIELHHLFIGAEGSLGVITEVTLRVFPIPEVRRFLALGFPSFESGFQAVVEMRKLGLKPAMMDFTEEDFPAPQQMGSSLDTLELPSILYLAFEGCQEEVRGAVRRGLEVCRQWGARRLSTAQVHSFWETRHDTAYRWRERRAWGDGGHPLWGKMEYLHLALPVSRVLDYRRHSLRLFSEAGVFVQECGLWGQPELFSVMVTLPENARPQRVSGMVRAVEAALTHAQDMGGSMEYCHGVGVRLAHLMPRELGGESALLKRIKESLDPKGILNPGKLCF